MRVRDIMRSEVPSCGPETDLGIAGRTMAEAACGFLPVIARGKVIGMLTDRDICLALAQRNCRPSDMQVQDVISGELFTCGTDDHIAEALETMRIFGFRRLPVVDDEQRLLGILSLDDLILESRALGSEGFDGPFHSDVTRALKGICSRAPSLALAA